MVNPDLKSPAVVEQWSESVVVEELVDESEVEPLWSAVGRGQVRPTGGRAKLREAIWTTKVF